MSQNLDNIIEVNNVIDFGADKTGVLDSTAAIQAAIDNAGTTKTVIVPYGTFLISNKITNPELVLMKCFGKLNYTGTGDGIELGHPTIAKRPKTYEQFSIRLENTDSVGSSTGTGVNLRNCSGLNIAISVDNFQNGLRLQGDRAGCQLNNIFLGRVFNNLNGIYLEQSVSGFVNQNTFYGGSISTQSTYSCA